MKRLNKALLTLIIITVFTTITLWGLASQLKPETLKPYINNKLMALTGHEGQINGTMSWRLYPSPGIKITDISIGSKQSNSPYFMTIDDLSLNLKLSPLLHGQFLFNEVNINGLHLDIHANTTQALKENNPQHETKHRDTVFPTLVLEHFLLSHGEITYPHEDGLLTISKIQLASESLKRDKLLFPVQVRANIQEQIKEDKIKTLANFKGKIRLTTAFIQNPFHHLQDILLDGQITLQNIKTPLINIETLNANTTLSDSILSLQPLTLTLYQGQSVGNLQYHLKTKEIDLNQTATHLNAKSISRDLFKESLFSGSLDASLHLKTLLTDTWREHLNGRANLSVKDGEIQALDLYALVQGITQHIHLLLTQAPSQLNHAQRSNALDNYHYQKGKTAFSLISIPFQVSHGIAKSEAGLLQTKNLQIKGQGLLNLTTLEIKSQLAATLLDMSPNIEKIQQILGGHFPISLSGTLPLPIFQVDKALINPMLAKAFLEYTLSQPLIDFGDDIKKAANL